MMRYRQLLCHNIFGRILLLGNRALPEAEAVLYTIRWTRLLRSVFSEHGNQFFDRDRECFRQITPF
jgi:hypothetical protein